MSLRSVESDIASEARVVFKNPKLRVKDMMEWSSGDITPHEGEVVERMPILKVSVAIKREMNKRQEKGGLIR